MLDEDITILKQHPERVWRKPQSKRSQTPGEHIARGRCPVAYR